MNRLLLFAFFLFTTFQGVALTGMVQDNESGKPIPEAKIFLEVDGKLTQIGKTDAKGAFSVEIPEIKPESKTRLVVKREGYQKVAFPVTDNIKESLRITLQKERDLNFPEFGPRPYNEFGSIVIYNLESLSKEMEEKPKAQVVRENLAPFFR